MQVVASDTAYHRVWRHVLGDWLGWSPRRVEAFCRDQYRPGDMWFLHLSPIQHIGHLLVPSPHWWERRFWWDSDPGWSLRLQWRLTSAAGIDDAAVVAGTFDWAAARERVEAILREVGARLPGR